MMWAPSAPSDPSARMASTDGAPELFLLRSIRELGQNAGIGEVPARGLRRPVRHIPKRNRNIDVERIEHGRQPVQNDSIELAADGHVLDRLQMLRASGLDGGIGDVGEGQPMQKIAGPRCGLVGRGIER